MFIRHARLQRAGKNVKQQPIPIPDVKQQPIPVPTNSVVPMVVHVIWHSQDMPPQMELNIQKLKMSNPEFMFRLYDQLSAREFISAHFEADVVDAFDSLIPMAYKADLFRACVLYIIGGIYIDSKMEFINNFKLIHLTGQEYVGKDVPEGKLTLGIANAVLSSKPNNPYYKRIVYAIVRNVKDKFFGYSPLCITGPCLWGEIYENMYGKKCQFDLENYSDSIYRFKGVEVIRQYDGYREEQRKSKELYYWDAWLQNRVYKTLPPKKIVVTMTTTPNRINSIKTVLLSLLNQTVMIDHIEINIPYYFKRTMEMYEIPGWMTTFPKLHIHRTLDYGSITKVAPTLLRHQQDTDCIVISVDDDMIYPTDHFELLLYEFDDTPTVWTYTGGMIKDNSYVPDLFNCTPHIVEGFSGVVYPPSCIKDDFIEYLETTSSNEDCRRSDDIILSNYLHKHGTTIRRPLKKRKILDWNSPDLSLPHGHNELALHNDTSGGHYTRYKQVLKWLSEKNILYIKNVSISSS